MIKHFLKPRPLYIFIDNVLIFLSFTSAYFLKYTYLIDNKWSIDFSYWQEYCFIFLLWAIFINISFHIKNLYSTDRSLDIPGEIMKVFLAIGYTILLVGAVIFFTKYKFFSRYVFIISFIFLNIFLSSFRIIKRVIIRKLIKKGFHNINVLIVGADHCAKTILQEINMRPWWGFKVVGFLDDHKKGMIEGIPIVGKIDDFQKQAKKLFVEEVIVVMSSYERVVPDLIQKARRLRLGIRLFPANFGENLTPKSVTYLGFLPLFNYGDKNYYISGFVIKRIIDFLGSLILLIVLLPLLVLIIIIIKIDSPGPIFYNRPRMGIKGKIFNFYKFRSMIRDAELAKGRLWNKNEAKGDVIFKIKADPRITKVGCFLRKHSLDELPQLFNVLKGDMSLVGPRPFPVDESRKIEYKYLPRLNIRPGITGLPQVRGRSDLSFRQWVKWDLWYINNWSFALDLQILLWTMPVVIKGKGAY